MAVKMILTVVVVVLQVIINCSQAQDHSSQHAGGGNTAQYKGSVSGEDTGPYMDDDGMYLLHSCSHDFVKRELTNWLYVSTIFLQP